MEAGAVVVVVVVVVVMVVERCFVECFLVFDGVALLVDCFCFRLRKRPRGTGFFWRVE